MRYRSYRFPCEHPVVVGHHGERLPAQIVNISTEGARLSGLGGLEAGERLRLELGSGEPAMLAEVRWTRGNLAGLRFDAPLAPRQLALIRRSIGSSANPRSNAWNLQLRELR